jgi:NADH-quinone oxidoreductase subunit H
VGILYVLAITSLGVYGIVLSGWASNNKYSLLGGLRSSAQMMSYELPMGMSIIVGVLMSSRNGGNLGLGSIVASQDGGFWHWNFLVWGPVGFLAALMYYTCGVAETNRAPFDLPEAETELIGGYHTEYGSMKWAMFFLGEYANMVNVSAILVTVFFGGWLSPIPVTLFPDGSILSALGSVFWFIFKIFAVIMVYLWLRATLPRLRYDRLMGFAWKRMLPASLILVLFAALILTLGYDSRQPGERSAAPVRVGVMR